MNIDLVTAVRKNMGVQHRYQPLMYLLADTEFAVIAQQLSTNLSLSKWMDSKMTLIIQRLSIGMPNIGVALQVDSGKSAAESQSELVWAGVSESDILIDYDIKKVDHVRHLNS